jgi:hypothetical protein
MKLVRVYRTSSRVDELVRENFGPCESLWKPKCFDRLYKLVDGHRILAVCTLQWSGAYWILGDLCTAEHGKGHGSEIVRLVCSTVRGSIWADAVNSISEQIFKKNSFKISSIKPWGVEGVPMMLLRE